MADSPPHNRIVPIMTPRKSASQPTGNGSGKRAGEAGMVCRRDLHIECLKERRLYAVPTVGDGNCLFYSLSDQLFGHPGRQDEIRARLVEHIRTNSDYFIQFVSDVGGERRAPRRAAAARAKLVSSNGRAATMDGQRAKFEELLSNMRENGSWGGSVEIQAFCQAYQRDVIVYADEGITPFTSVLDPSVKKGQPVHIAYHTFRHYSSVRSVDGPHDGLPVVSRPSGHGLEGQDASSEGKAEDDDGASSTDDVGEAHWPKTVAEALPGRSRAAARAELAACRAELEAVDVEKAAQEEGMTVRLYRNMFNHYKSEFDRAVACIRDLHDDDPSSQSSLDSANTSPPAPASSAAPSPATAPATAAGPSSSPTKPRRRLIRGTRPPPRTWLGSSSRSSSRNSTASKRSAGQSDDDDESDSSRPLARRQRGRDRKRRILQDVTLGISDKNDDENSDITSVRPRVSPDAVVEQAEASLNEGSTAVHERTAGVSASSATIASADDGASSNSGSNEEASTAGESDSEFEDDS